MKVGDYVKTKQGYIRQIKEIYDHILYYVNLDKSITMERYGKFEPITQLDRDTIDEIIKSSPNIIDLIEVGDYVNGQKVLDKLYDELNKCWYLKLEIGEVFGKYERTYQQHIKSIVTREMFENIEYKVEVDKNE